MQIGHLATSNGLMLFRVVLPSVADIGMRVDDSAVILLHVICWKL